LLSELAGDVKGAVNPALLIVEDDVRGFEESGGLEFRDLDQSKSNC
jgi:hypothetical protein